MAAAAVFAVPRYTLLQPTPNDDTEDALPLVDATPPASRRLTLRFMPFSMPRRVRARVLIFIAMAGLIFTITAFIIHRGNKASENDGAAESAQKLPWPKAIRVTGDHGTVAAEHPTCSAIGVDALRDGGSAVDAAIAAALCTGAINSFSSGIGGGGFMLIRQPNAEYDFIDYRESAPAMATEDMYAKNPQLAIDGGLAIGVPGELRGFEMAHRRHGRLPFARLIQPTIDLLAHGFPVSELLAKRIHGISDLIRRDVAFADIFTREGRTDGTILVEGDVCRRPALARTLRTVSENGTDAFYHGELPKRMAREIQAAGGIITVDDFAQYIAKRGDIIDTTFATGTPRAVRVVSSPAPTSGPALIHIINILDGFLQETDSASFNAILQYHRIIETFKYGFTARAHLGDPDYVDIKDILKQIVSKDFASQVRANISDTHTFPPKHYQPEYANKGQHGTMHISVATADGGAVSLMSTVNHYFGAKVMSRSTGVIFNNEMDDFSTPNVTNSFGLPASPMNFIQPGKRSQSSSAPTIVESIGSGGRFKLFALGGSGGTRILTAIAQVLLEVVQDMTEDISDAVNRPRFHHQLYPNSLSVEAIFNGVVAKGLSILGHHIEWSPKELSQSSIQVVGLTKWGTLEGASDGRKRGIAVAYDLNS